MAGTQNEPTSSSDTVGDGEPFFTVAFRSTDGQRLVRKRVQALQVYTDFRPVSAVCRD